MPIRKIDTLQELIYWSYANLQMLDAAVFSLKKDKYDRICYMIRAKAFKAYMEGRWHITDLYKQQIDKIQQSNIACAYCGKVFNSPKEISVDHIFPRIKGGGNEMENILFVCKTCNSSKNDNDLMGWYISHFKKFPSIYLTATYLKKVYLFAKANSMLQTSLSEINTDKLPFDYHCIPIDYPEPSEYREIWCMEDKQK